MSLSEVGYLIPVNQSLEEEGSVPKLPITDGTNVIGRNSIPVPDKRLSRKHLTLTASRDGSANLLVVLAFTTHSFFTFLNSFFFFFFHFVISFRFVNPRRGRTQSLLIPGIREGN